MEPAAEFPERTELEEVAQRRAEKREAQPEPEVVHALANQGKHGVVPCQRDYQRSLPQFAVDCELAEGDESAWIEIMARARGRLLGYRVGRVLAHRGKRQRPYFFTTRASTKERIPSARWSRQSSAIAD
jgi:hypothetical protein